ncbi:unnamed protein product [Lathyrus oleraceus]
MGLVDIPLLDRRFTWYHFNGVTMRRMNRILFCEAWEEDWGQGSLWALPKDAFDYCLIVLKHSSQFWGPKLYRFNNFWLGNTTFGEVVRDI